MQEIAMLREENMELTGKNQKKQYTIAPTLYTYYKNNILKNRVSRYGLRCCVMDRAASQVTQSLLECKEEEEDRDAYNEDIINLCAQPHPNPFFQSNSFLEIFEHQCQQMSGPIHRNSPVECILASEPRLLKLKSPIYVFGDFHGNIQDLLAFSRILWPLGMHLTPGSFLFLGDYVDRGAYSIEVLTYLFAQKIMLPDKVFLLRGNHELRAVNISSPSNRRLPALRRHYRRRHLLRARRNPPPAGAQHHGAGEHWQYPLPHAGACSGGRPQVHHGRVVDGI